MSKMPEYFHFRVVVNAKGTEVVELQDVSDHDWVDVVRCKDCVYYNTTGCAVGFGWCEEPTVSNGVDDNYYCAGGERRDDQ